MKEQLKINIITAKSILTKSNLPGCDYVINPYNGCQFSCMYCYAAQIARWKHPNDTWGSYVDVKVNAPEVLQLELLKLEKKHKSKNFGSIFFSSVTDPYQGVELKYQLTRKCLEVLLNFGYEGEISILTKSPSVLRDIDIFKKLRNISVGLTVTSLNDNISKFLEVNAPLVNSRIEALYKLHNQEIPTYAFVGPILPYYMKDETIINTLLDKLEEVGIETIWFELINLNAKIRSRLYDYLKTESPNLIDIFETTNTKEYRLYTSKVITNAMKGRNIKLGLNQVIHHDSLNKNI